MNSYGAYNICIKFYEATNIRMSMYGAHNISMNVYGASNISMNMCGEPNICMNIYGASNICMNISRITLRNCITESYYGIILGNYNMAFYRWQSDHTNDRILSNLQRQKLSIAASKSAARCNASFQL